MIGSSWKLNKVPYGDFVYDEQAREVYEKYGNTKGKLIRITPNGAMVVSYGYGKFYYFSADNLVHIPESAT